MTQEQQDKIAFFAAYIESNYYREIKKYTGESNIVGPWKAIGRFVSIEDMDSFNKRAYKNIISVNDYLELTPLSEITDEDAIEVAKICNSDHKEEFLPQRGREIIRKMNTTMRVFPEWQEVIDYFRSRGYLLPFRQYSTQQLLDMGWAKLKTK